jgi:hypothetical protein
MMKKVLFLSKEWIDIADSVLREIVVELGEEGKKFSVSESLANAPSEIAEKDGFVYYHILIDGKSAKVCSGKLEEATLKIQASYDSALKSAYIYYTPELIEEYAKNPPKRDYDPYEKVEGDMASSPSYITEFHNQMVAFTL